MAGKTHSRFVTVTYNSQDITDSVDNINGLGLEHAQEDVSTLASQLDEFLHGRQSLNIELSGPFNTTATTGAHNVIQALNGDNSGATLTIAIGDQAAPTTGDPEFEVSNMGTFNYMVQVGGGPVTWSAALRPLASASAAWGTVSA